MSRTDVFDLDNGYKVSRFVDIAAGSGTWSTPSIPSGWRLVFHRIVAINGGDGGNYYQVSTFTRGGGFRRKDVSSLPSSVSYVVGAGGAGATTYGNAGTVGGASSFGTSGDAWYLVGIPDIGVIDTMDGSLLAASTPGRGGAGRGSAGDSGGSSAGAAGGQGGTPGNDGGNGASADLSQFEVYGGGGGGGGGPSSQFLTSAGGNGGTPGGGGGGGAQYGPRAGNGAPGCIAVYTYMLPADMGGTV